MFTKTLLTAIVDFAVKNLIVIHKGSVTAKIGSAFKLSVSISPFVALAEKITLWTVANSDYILWVLWAILVDWIVGVIYHIKIKDFNWGKNALGVSLKIGLALFAGSLFEGLPYFIKHESLVSDILIVTTRLAVFLYPAGSAFMNMYEVTDGAFPPIGFIKKIKLFNEKFDVKVLTEKQEE